MHSCDGCTLCCKLLKIHELNKAGNTWCQHCRIGAGCDIYDTRPESCRVYECLWLKTQRGAKPLDPALRPDRSRVIMGTTNQGEDVVLYLSPDRPDAWRHGSMARLVAELQHKNVTVLLSCGDTLEKL